MRSEKFFSLKIIFITILSLVAISVSGVNALAKPIQGSANTFVHLFEWSWDDVAQECEIFLGPNGYSAVQISPPQEHILGPQWWVRYQPVSYKIESRSGNRKAFSEMVKRCKAVGVDIYADVLINHMAGIFPGKGTAGSEYKQFEYVVPYSYDDFHHCGRNDDDRITNYQDLWEVQTCNLGSLVDLDTSKPKVQKKILGYLNDLINLGVAGFRMDAAKHISDKDIGEIINRLDSKPYIFQEVIDRGGEPINAMDYLPFGDVTETKYPQAITKAFKSGDLRSLSTLHELPGYLPADQAVVFIDNHDIQRGHAGGDNNLSFKDGQLYDLANVFMLSWPYGYPKVMSSYHFDDTDQGPPTSRVSDNQLCNDQWVCEHRRPIRTKMVKFRKTLEGLEVNNWNAYSDQVISFSRGEIGHVIINIGKSAYKGSFQTSLKPNKYCNILAQKATKKNCSHPITVDQEGLINISIAPMSAVVILASSLK